MNDYGPSILLVEVVFLLGIFLGFILTKDYQKTPTGNYIQRLNNTDTKLDLCIKSMKMAQKVIDSQQIVYDILEKDHCLKPKKENQK